jgi:hypothetical protein
MGDVPGMAFREESKLAERISQRGQIGFVEGFQPKTPVQFHLKTGMSSRPAVAGAQKAQKWRVRIFMTPTLRLIMRR